MSPFKLHGAVVTRGGDQSSGLNACGTQKRILEEEEYDCDVCGALSHCFQTKPISRYKWATRTAVKTTNVTSTHMWPHGHRQKSEMMKFVIGVM